METLTLETKTSPHVIIQSIDGDLRLVGQPGHTLEAQAPSKGQLSIHQEAERVVLSCRSGCLVFLPSQAVVQAESVAGDLHLTGVLGRSSVRAVDGDVRLRRTGEVEMGRLDGDLSADEIGGELRVDSVGGDADVRHVRGDVQLAGVGGDLRLRQVDGAIEASVEGDASARMTPPPDSTSRIRAEGDISVVLPGDTSALVRVSAGGDLLLPDPSERVVIEGPGVICCGSGSASVELTCDGDLSLRLGGLGQPAEWGADLQEQINARVQSSIAEMEASLEDLGLDSLDIDSGRIGQRVRKAVARALRAAGGAGIMAGATHEDRTGSTAKAESVAGDEEHLAVLRMLEEGKINAEQAEALLRALEDEG